MLQPVTLFTRVLSTLRAAHVAGLALTCVGCLQAGYLVQAAYGQDEIAFLAEPIDEVLRGHGAGRRTRELLALIADVKRYGEAHGIEPTDSYRHYVALDRPAVVWVVSAAQPLSFESKTWTFPIVGSVPYLGWFNQRDAMRHVKELSADGWEVDVRGASAYSTLGWFDDPILSSMIRDHDGATGALVDVVLHESVHATHYVRSQSTFNESLADFVADTLTPVYLVERLGFDRWQILEHEQRLERGRQRALLFHDAYKELDALYRSALSDADKLATKARIIDDLMREVDFPRAVNNATLAQSRTYHGGVSELVKVLACVEGDWMRFWRAVRTIDEASFANAQEQDLSRVLGLLLRRCKQT